MRRRPYTARGIRRVPCIRCGAPSEHQWNACALGGQYFAVCIECDIGLNELALTYMRFPDAERILAEYAEKARAA
jgi:hypothetical protein